MTKLAGWLAIALLASAPGFAATLSVYDHDLVTFGRLRELDTATGIESTPSVQASCNFLPPDVLFSIGFATGLAFRDGVLHGVIATGLFQVSYTGAGCAEGAAIGSLAASPNLESLAYCPSDGFFYSQRFDFGVHIGQLVRIDAATGAGANVGSPMPSDVRLVGMDCDDDGTLWAVSSGFGSRVPELFTVNRTTGAATLIGATGTVSNTHESLAIGRSSPTFRLFAAGSSLHELDPTTGAATLLTAGVGKVWASATTLPEPDGAGAAGCISLFALRRLRRVRSGPRCDLVQHRNARSA